MTMSFPRRKLLADLRIKPREMSSKYKPLIWALREGYAIASGGRYFITPAGAQALAEAEMDPSLRQALKLLPRLVGKTLCRTASADTEAVERGGGYLYFTRPDNRPFPPTAGRLLIEQGHLVPLDDGLLAGVSQSFMVAPRG